MFLKKNTSKRAFVWLAGTLWFIVSGITEINILHKHGLFQTIGDVAGLLGIPLGTIIISGGVSMYLFPAEYTTKDRTAAQVRTLSYFCFGIVVFMILAYIVLW